MIDQSTVNTVVANWIGIDENSTVDTGNDGNGIMVYDCTAANTIGRLTKATSSRPTGKTVWISAGRPAASSKETISARIPAVQPAWVMIDKESLSSTGPAAP